MKCPACGGAWDMGRTCCTETLASLRVEVVRVAEGLRDRCRKEMAMCAEDPETYGDPGDARIDIEGNGWNVCTVLNLLRAIGIEGCE